MRISVENLINTELKEVFTFNQFDLNIVFVEYLVMEKPKGKRLWKVTNKWDKYSRTDYIQLHEPILSEDIKDLVLKKTVEQIKILTFKEWKQK